MDIKKAVEMINSGKSLRQTAKDLLGDEKKESSIRWRLKREYVKNKEGKYILNSAQNETTKEEKNIRTKEEKYDILNERNTKPTKEEKSKVRKRASFDIDSDLLKELKIFAINEEKNVYEVVENAIRTYLREGK
jgi:hypothetical protein